MEKVSSQGGIRVIILAGFLLMAGAVAAISKFTYDRVNELTLSLAESVKTNPRVDELKELIDTIRYAEDEVLKYASQEIVQDELASAFTPLLSGIRTQKDLLELDSIADSWDQPYINEALNLFDRKFEVLDSLIERLEYAEDYDAYGNLQKTISKLEQQVRREERIKARNRQKQLEEQPKEAPKPIATPPLTVNTEPQTETKEERKGLFDFLKKDPKKKEAREQRRLERRENKKKNKQEKESEPNPPKGDTLPSPELQDNITEEASVQGLPESKQDKILEDVVKKSRTQAKDNPTAVIRNIKNSAEFILNKTTQELSGNDSIVAVLLSNNREYDRQISEVVREMEKYQKEQLAKKANYAFAQQDQTDRLLKGFLIAILLLFFILSIIIFTNISRNQQLQNYLSTEKARTEKLANAKEEFLANMSHDIRTPMNAIIGFTKQLSETKLNRQQYNFVDTIQQSGRYLLGLINDILDYTKLESGHFLLDSVAFSPADVLTEVQRIYENQAKQKGIRLETKIDKKLPKVITGDPLRLKQMLFNLVNNAIKFTDKGEIIITASSKMLKKQKCLLSISVKDTGIGIPQDKLDQIFGAYQQAEFGTARKYGGTGLGLAITHKLVKTHKGTLSVDSTPNIGTTFTLAIPYALGKASEVTQLSSVELDPTPLKGKRVLLADDEPFNLALLETILDKWDIYTKSVDNGKSLVQHLAVTDYDYALIDLQMPEMDGFQTARYIREQLASDIPVIALTATSTPKEMNAALDAGVNHVMLKPFDEMILLEKMIQLGKERSLNQENG